MIQTLEQAGHRVTEPRSQLIKAVVAQKERLTGGPCTKLKEAGLGRTTVFGTLLLQDLGLLSRLHLPEGCQHYIVSPPEHQDGKHHDRITAASAAVWRTSMNAP